MNTAVIDLASNLRSTFAVLLGIIVTVQPSPAIATGLADQVRAAVANVVEIWTDARLKSEAQKSDRRSQLMQVMNADFDFEEMARRSLGVHWQDRTRREQIQFVTLFTSAWAESYLATLGSCIGRKFVYSRQLQDGDFAEVTSKIVGRDREDRAIDYKFHSRNGRWKIYDVLIENVSLVNTYRSEFDRILTTVSFKELIKRLEQKRVDRSNSEKLRVEGLISYSIMSAASIASRPH